MKRLERILLLFSLLLILCTQAFAQQSSNNFSHPTLLKCERTFTKNTSAKAKQKALSEKFVCKYEFVALKDNLSPVSTSPNYRNFLYLEVPAKKTSAMAVHELGDDFKLVKVTTSGTLVSNLLYCEDKKGELTEIRNDQIETPWSDKGPLKSTRTWSYKSILKCDAITGGNGTA
jgi:hypothetical protein